MLQFKQIESGAQVAQAVVEAFENGNAERGSQTAFFRDAMKSKKTTAYLCEGLRLLAETPEKRQAKNVEAGPFYMARTILGSESRMTDPKTGKYWGHFTIDTKSCEKKDKLLVTAPKLVAKVQAADKEADPEPTALDAKKALVKWAKGKGIPYLSALLDNDPADIHTALSDTLEEMATADRKATADKANEGEAVKRAA